MLITSHEEYGLRCAVQLARSFAEGKISASKVSDREGISVEYVSKFMHLFRKSKLVHSVRGTQGGFVLVRPPAEIFIKDVLTSLTPERSRSSNFCEHYKGHRAACSHLGACSVRPVWAVVTNYFDTVMGSLTLQDLCASEKDVQEKIRKISAKGTGHVEARAS